MKYAMLFVILSTALWIASFFALLQISYSGITTSVAAVGDGGIFLGQWYKTEQHAGWRFVLSEPDPYEDEIHAFRGPHFLGLKVHTASMDPLLPGTFIIIPLWILIVPPLVVLGLKLRRRRHNSNNGNLATT